MSNTQISKITDARKARFSSAVWFDNIPVHKILLIGAGGVGSWLALFLSRIGYQIYLVDFDIIEIHNLSGQTFRIEDIGRPKIDAVKSLTKYLGCTNNIYTYNVLFKYSSLSIENYDIFISAVDTVDARFHLFETFKKSIVQHRLYIEARLSAESFQLYIFDETMTVEQTQEYTLNLTSLEGLSEDACSFKQTSHIAAMIGSVITSVITNWSSNIILKANINNVPNYIEFNANLLMLNTK